MMKLSIICLLISFASYSQVKFRGAYIGVQTLDNLSGSAYVLGLWGWKKWNVNVQPIFPFKGNDRVIFKAGIDYQILKPR